MPTRYSIYVSSEGISRWVGIRQLGGTTLFPAFIDECMLLLLDSTSYCSFPPHFPSESPLSLSLPSYPPPSPSYGNLALFFQSMGESELALRLFRRTLQLMALASGAPLQHPGASTLFINIALTYQVRPSCCSGILRVDCG